MARSRNLSEQRGGKGGVLDDLTAGQASQYDLLAAGNGKMKALGKSVKKSGYKVKTNNGFGEFQQYSK